MSSGGHLNSGFSGPVGRNYWRLGCCSQIVPRAAMLWGNRTGLDICGCGVTRTDWEALLNE